MKNSIGHNTGKAIVTFEQESQAQSAQEKFDNNAVENLICRVRPYYDRKGETPRKAPALLQRRLYLMNLPYDTTKREIEGLVKEFAEIDDIAIPRDKYERCLPNLDFPLGLAEHAVMPFCTSREQRMPTRSSSMWTGDTSALDRSAFRNS